jgi:hypothetical protein
MGDDPVASRPDIPDYGIPGSRKGLLDWKNVRGRLEESAIYWLATASPEGLPHTVPVWGVWLDDRLYFDGGARTRHLRNVAANPRIAVHLESGNEVVIVEGTAGAASVPDPELTVRVADGYRAKYGGAGYSPKPDSWDGGGLWVVHPQCAFAWTKFPGDATRFRF